jgi:hypothetical protein
VSARAPSGGTELADSGDASRFSRKEYVGNPARGCNCQKGWKTRAIRTEVGIAGDAPIHRRTSLDVLNLLAHLLDDHFHIHRAARGLEILGLR